MQLAVTEQKDWTPQPVQTDRRRALTTLAVLTLTVLSPGTVSADRRGRRRDDDDDWEDQAAAARARAAGEIVPLTEILDHVQTVHPGEVVAIELDREKARWVYEVKLIEPGGRFVEIYVDARDKRILKIEGK